ncbi:tigger transposable element-derived protein 4 [Trichonephila clavipes]|uniref:Tigger transposable element-derived protein 4 n=1 Tax=Trichonephila clavipes TaxID=2585209 RepID=A0A8X6VZ34_TRICX|nr:tigger transposable element-derived protein 4 [Trichonephila clavipes]
MNSVPLEITKTGRTQGKGWSCGDLRFLPVNFNKPWAFTPHLSVDLSREMSDMSFKKYNCLTISEKQKVIESVEEGERKVDVAKAFEIPLSSLSTILKNKEEILSASSSRVRKRVSKGNFPRELASWMRQCRGQSIPMGGSLLKEKVKAFVKELGIEFSASEGWLTNFKKRNGIVFKKMCGESSSVDINVCSKWQNSLSDLIKEYEPRFPSPNLVDVDDTLTEFNAEPSLWEALAEQDLTFDYYVLVDTDIAVWGALSDAEIVALDHNNTESDEDESEDLYPVILSEAKVSLNKLRNFFLQNHVDADI